MDLSFTSAGGFRLAIREFGRVQRAYLSTGLFDAVVVDRAVVVAIGTAAHAQVGLLEQAQGLRFERALREHELQHEAASVPRAARAPDYDAPVLSAAWWAGIASSFLLLGAWIGVARNATTRTTGLVMAFGAGR
jgi:hypothetical protein